MTPPAERRVLAGEEFLELRLQAPRHLPSRRSFNARQPRKVAFRLEIDAFSGCRTAGCAMSDPAIQRRRSERGEGLVSAGPTGLGWRLRAGLGGAAAVRRGAVISTAT